MNQKSNGKSRLKALSALGIVAMAATSLQAQVFTVLHQFSQPSASSGMTNSDGAEPYQTGVILSGNQLYGTTYYGGTNGNGVVFSLTTDGSNFAVLHTFSAAPAPDYTNSDGEAPEGGLLLLGGLLYGTSLNGGTNSGGYGTLFSVGTNGADFELVHSFNFIPDGENPNGPLVVSGNTLFGTTQAAGATNGYGTIFSVGADGTDFTVLHTLLVTATNYPLVNQDGGYPNCGLILSGNTLYGSTQFIGTNGHGTIFSLQTNGDNFTVLHTFSAGVYNADGSTPESPLLVSGDAVYGTTTLGGTNDDGTLFSMKTNGDAFTVLHTFTGGSDGSDPDGLLLSGGVLYGVTVDGGTGGDGVVYSINPDGSDFTVLYTFSPTYTIRQTTNYDGAHPQGPLVLSGNTLYGTAEQGGLYGNGTVFSLEILPGISSISSITSIRLAGTNLVLNGTNGASGETNVLLMSTNLTLPRNQWTPLATNVLTGNSFTIIATNAVDPAAPRRFYTLQEE